MKRLLSIAFIATTLFACSKSDSDEPNSNHCIVNEISNSDASKSSFKYDSEGKIISATYINEGSTYAYSISYGSSRIYIAETRNGTALDTYAYTLVDGKVVDKSSNYGLDKFAYHSDGFLSSITYDSGIKVTLSYSNNNLTQLKSSYANQIYTIDYNLNESRVPFSEFQFSVFTEWGPTAMFEDALLYEQGFYGKKTSKQISSFNADGDEYRMSFIKDSGGKVVSGKTEYSEISFKYDCK